MKVGYAIKNITPDHSVYMAGYDRKEKSTGVLDEILLNTMVLEIKDKKIIFVIIDSIMLDLSFCDHLRKDICKRWGIEMNNIFISCIHTHSAPAYFKLIWEDTQVENELLKELYKECIKSVEEAILSQQECLFHLRKCWIEGLYGNRNEKDGWSDKSAYVLEFTNHSQIICQLINISVHPTILNGQNFLLSSDLLGAIRRKYQEKTNVPTMICNGATGDVSTRFYRQCSGVEELEKVSQEITEQILLSKYLIKDKYFYSFLSVDVEYMTSSDFSKDPITLETLNTQNQLPMIQFFKDRCQKKLDLKSFDMLMNSIILKIDHLFIVSLPGDVVSYFAKKIRDELEGNEVIFLCYTNNYCNYLVNEEDYGKYFETFNSRCMKGEADIFVNKVIQKAKSLI